MNHEELKPCPFCGSPASKSEFHGVYCTKTDCQLNKLHPVFTVEIWNTRHDYHRGQMDAVKRVRDLLIVDDVQIRDAELEKESAE